MTIKTYIPKEELMRIAEDEGCTLTPKTTCVMVTKGKSKNRLYISNTKEVNRVHINGFRIPDPELACMPPNGVCGTFVQVVRFDHPGKVVRSNFRTICKNLDVYTPSEKKPRQRPAGLRGSNKKNVETVVVVKSEETPQQTVDRLVAELAKKKDLAKKLGFPLSKKTEKEIMEQIEKARKQIGG
jgi:hypothetical protein